MGALGFAPGVSSWSQAGGPSPIFHLVESLNGSLFSSYLLPKPVSCLIAK